MSKRRLHTLRCSTALSLAVLATACAQYHAPEPGVPCEIRGRVISKATGQAIGESAPIVIMAQAVIHKPQRGSSTHLVQRQPEGFTPSFSVLHAGHELRFENKDKIFHQFVSSSNPNAFSLGLIKPGESKTRSFDHPGSVEIFCSLHSDERMTLLVTATPYFAVVDERGEFRISDLPQGIYVLETWSSNRPSTRLRVSATEGASRIVEIEVEEPR